MNIPLIKGTFDKKEALNLITQLVHIKVKYHESRIEKSHTEEDIEMREKRIRQLHQDLYYAREYLASFEDTVELDSEIGINESIRDEVHPNDQVNPYNLVKGNFSPDEAQTILNDLVDSKIKHHNIEAFRIQEKTGGDISHSKKRVKELKELKVQLGQLIEEARKKGKSLHIDGTLNLSFVN